MTKIRMPNITAKTERGQLEQIRSYLYQVSQELNWALSQTVFTKSEAIVPTAKPVSQVEKSQSTFNDVKGLIIKSADIVNAYYEEISHRLEGVYVAESDFGKYREETSLTLEANSKNVNLLFENQQSIDNVLVRGESSTTIKGSDAWVKIGVLFYGTDGYPVYGMEIGQVNSHGNQQESKMLAQYRSDGVHLFDEDGTEVATITKRQLKITNAQIANATVTGSMTVGGYEISTNNGLTFKWKGRG